MADIVAVHGINMSRESRAGMQRAWHAAISDGLGNIRMNGVDLVIECAFYGHLYNSGKALNTPPYSPNHLTQGFEQDLFLELAGTEPHQTDTKVYLPSVLQRAAGRLQQMRLLDGGTSLVIHWIKQVNRYFEDSAFAAKVATEMDAAIVSGPRVVVAHSLGSVIAFDWLRGNAERFTGTLLTIGSPLGFRAIRTRLGISDQSRWPGGVYDWVNIAASEDAIATVKKLGPLYDPRVQDRLMSNPRRSPHSALEYLRNVTTAEALAAALD